MTAQCLFFLLSQHLAFSTRGATNGSLDALLVDPLGMELG